MSLRSGPILRQARHRTSRVIRVNGPKASPLRLLRVPHGARIADVIDEKATITLSGKPGAERKAAYLGRFDTQITLLQVENRKRRTPVSITQARATAQRFPVAHWSSPSPLMSCPSSFSAP